MKSEWSSKWISSAKPRKQRKYRENAPLHVRRKFLSANLSEALRERAGRRSAVVRKGDVVIVMRGDIRGKSGPVERVNLRQGKVYVEGIKNKKVDGSEVSRALEPSNLMITKLGLDDKRRQAALERTGKAEERKPAAKKPSEEKPQERKPAAKKPSEAKPAKKEKGE